MKKFITPSLCLSLIFVTLTGRAQVSWLFTTVSPGNSGSGGLVIIVSNGSQVTRGQTSAGTSSPPAPAPVVCMYTLGATSANLGGGPVADAIRVTAPGGCAWTAQPGVPWIRTSSGGAGDGWVNYAVDANLTGTIRTGSLIVGGQTFTVTQAPQGYIWHDVFGWLFKAGSGWHHAEGIGWLWFDSGGQWIWSTSLQGWLSITDYRARQAWSTQFGWLTLPANDRARLDTAAVGPVHVGYYQGTGIPEGWVFSERVGYVWPSGDGRWFYSDQHGWLEATSQGRLWCAAQGRLL